MACLFDLSRPNCDLIWQSEKIAKAANLHEEYLWTLLHCCQVSAFDLFPLSQNLKKGMGYADSRHPVQGGAHAEPPPLPHAVSLLFANLIIWTYFVKNVSKYPVLGLFFMGLQSFFIEKKRPQNHLLNKYEIFPEKHQVLSQKIATQRSNHAACVWGIALKVPKKNWPKKNFRLGLVKFWKNRLLQKITRISSFFSKKTFPTWNKGTSPGKKVPLFFSRTFKYSVITDFRGI